MIQKIQYYKTEREIVVRIAIPCIFIIIYAAGRRQRNGDFMKLGQYKGLHTKKPVYEVREEEIDQVLKRKQKEYSVVRTIEDRAAHFGDEVNLDFYAEIKGSRIAGSERKNYFLLLGSHSFIPGFEEGIAGHRAGERFRLKLTFPKNYRIQSLAGKRAVYHIRINKLCVREYQPLDDNFALDFSEHDTLAAWREEICEELLERRRLSAEEKLQRELLTQIKETSVIRIDRELLEEVTDELFEDLLDQLEENGISLEHYCKRVRMNEKQLRAAKQEEAAFSISAQSILHAVAEAERLSVPEEAVREEIRAIALEEGEDPDVFAVMLGEEEKEAIADELLMNKAMEVILENTIFD